MFNPFQENSDKSVIELQQYARKNKPNLHILNKLQEEMTKLAKERVGNGISQLQKNCMTCRLEVILNIIMEIFISHSIWWTTQSPRWHTRIELVSYFLFLSLSKNVLVIMTMCLSFQEETRKKPKMTIMESAQPGSQPLCTVDV